MTKFVFGMQIKIEVFYKWITSTPDKKFAYLCNISRKMWGMKLIFCLQINMEVFSKLILSFWMCVSRYAQSTQNNKFAISFQYLKEKLILSFQVRVARYAHITQNNKVAISLQYIQKKVSNEIDFSHIDKHESSLQMNTMMFDGSSQTLPKFPKHEVYNVFTISPKTSQR